MFGLGKPIQHLVAATCGVCGYESETIRLERLDNFICVRCIERAILWAADQAKAVSMGDADARNRYRPSPSPPSRSVRCS